MNQLFMKQCVMISKIVMVHYFLKIPTLRFGLDGFLYTYVYFVYLKRNYLNKSVVIYYLLL